MQPLVMSQSRARESLVKAERHLFNLMALAVLVFIICYGLASLQEVLVPFTLALFLCQLFEWPAQILVQPRNWFLERTKSARIWSTWFGRAIKRAIIVFTDIFVIMLCVALLMGLVFAIVYGLSNLFDKSRFAKYYQSPRVQNLIKFLQAHGVEITQEEIIRRIEDPLAAFVQGLLHFLETGFLTLMMLGFLLLGQLTQMHPDLPPLSGLIDELAIEPVPLLERVTLQNNSVINASDRKDSVTLDRLNLVMGMGDNINLNSRQGSNCTPRQTGTTPRLTGTTNSVSIRNFKMSQPLMADMQQQVVTQVTSPNNNSMIQQQNPTQTTVTTNTETNSNSRITGPGPNLNQSQSHTTTVKISEKPSVVQPEENQNEQIQNSEVTSAGTAVTSSGLNLNNIVRCSKTPLATSMIGSSDNIELSENNLQIQMSMLNNDNQCHDENLHDNNGNNGGIHPSSRFLQESYELTRHAKSTVQWYIILKTFMSALLAFMIGSVLYIVDVDFWFVFTVMAFLLNYIPTVGGAVSIIAPLIITFLDPNKSVYDIIAVFTLPGLAHVLCGNVIEPHLFGSAFDLHPIIVMFCLVVWSSLWGVTGAVLSVPLTCCLKLALKPNVTRHPYAMFLYHLMEFRLPDEETLEIFLQSDGYITPEIQNVDSRGPSSKNNNIATELG